MKTSKFGFNYSGKNGTMASVEISLSFIFIIRWIVCSVGLWICVQLFAPETLLTVSTATTVASFLLAGLIFTAVNAIVKPIIFILSLPFVLVTMGLFTLVINGFMVWLTFALLPGGIHMPFGWAIISSLIMSLINYLLNSFSYLSWNKEDK